MNILELTVKEVAEILGISESTVLKNWKQCSIKAGSLGIEKIGRGTKAVYIKRISEDKNKVAFEILREFFINECKFDTRTDFKKLTHYVYLVLLNTVDKDYYYNNLDYMFNIRIAEKNLIEYRRKLTKANVMKLKEASKGVYAYLDINDNYNVCDVSLYDNFNRCIILEAKRLLIENYTVDLTKENEYKKAKDIITNDFNIDELYNNLLVLPSSLQKELTKDTATNILFRADMDLSRFYKIAFYEVSKSWQEEMGIKHIKFFPNHILNDFVIKDMEFIEIIVNAYNYVNDEVLE